MELNNKLIQQNELYCVKCNSFLNFPIMLCENIGNICGRCYAKFPQSEETPTIRNTGLEAIIKYLEIPCRYKSEGCTVKLLQSDIPIHEECCSHRQYNCPSKENCFWRGSVNNLVKHFEELHPTLLLKSDCLVFEFDINLNSEFSSHMLLHSNSEIFLLQLDLLEDRFWCAVCYIGDEDKGSKYEFFIEEIGYKRSFYFRNDSKKAILSQSYINALDKDRAIQIEMAPLKLYFNNIDVITAKLVLLGGTPMEDLDESILSHLECPVCNLYMLPPIHQCLAGHNLCCKCRPKLGQCPTCRGRIENTRNYALEAVSAKTKYPCINRIFGCFVVLPGSLIESHEQKCKLRTYSCVVQNASCSWQGKHSELLEHLRVVHKIANSFQTKINYNGNQFYLYTTNYDLIIAFGEVFKIGHKYENNSQTTFWNCRVYGIHNKSKFKFRITYSNDLGDFMLVKTALCLPYTVDDEFFNHNLSFPQTLSTRIGNTVRCEITRL